MAFSTPDSYWEEQTVQPLPVSSGATAVPVFIGYTEKAVDNQGNDLTDALTPVGSLLDYEASFGGPDYPDLEVIVDIDGRAEVMSMPATSRLLYHSIDLYFKNGGGSGYILSLGDYSAPLRKQDFERALSVLQDEHGPTLILLTDAVNLSVRDYYGLCKSALAQCHELKDRFVILDVKDTRNAVADFRKNIGAGNLGYGAAYYPYLNTVFDYPYHEAKVFVKHGYGIFEIKNSIRITYAGPRSDAASVAITDFITGQTDLPCITLDGRSLTVAVGRGAGSAPSAIIAAWEKIADPGKFNIEISGTGSVFLAAQAASFRYVQDLGNLAGDWIKVDNPPVYDSVVAALKRNKVVLPPGCAAAAAYSGTDISTGPWKAPANVVLHDVTGPATHINNADQENLNVSPDGKSVNAIRSFANKGTLIWGARTLDGNSNEWRYIPVRRLFIKVENDIRRSTAFSVFEPNNSITWLKLKTMLIAYLDDLWSVGALNGATAEDAYFIKVGLGETMDEEDILEGRLNISVGIAALRPAEFVVMTVTHILQAS